MTCNGEVIVRPANDDDLEQIYHIELESFKYPYPREYLKALLALSGNLFLVLEVCGRIVGYVVGLIEFGVEGHVLSIAVAKSFRGRGYGKKLMLELESRFKERGVHRIKLEVRKSNTVAISMYRKLGYRIVGVIPRYYPDGEDAYIMVKELKE